MMRERVSGTRHVDGPRTDRTTLLAQTLRSLGKERGIVFLAVVLYNATVDLIAEKLEMQPTRVVQLFSNAISALRHPSRSMALRDYAFGSEDFDRTRLIDGELRALIREWQVAAMFEPICEQCETPLDIPWVAALQPRPGRPRRYCSNACRQKAYRTRRR
ncbi:hypothetical protein [Streptomyces sp. NPDC057889]|uniref:hypothetical protein n=1 Tax=unclassified Streptomyces TaxID=2593676 RepID=UPI0036BE6B1C